MAELHTYTHTYTHTYIQYIYKHVQIYKIYTHIYIYINIYTHMRTCSGELDLGSLVGVHLKHAPDALRLAL
jgi:hypothetical protein